MALKCKWSPMNEGPCTKPEDLPVYTAGYAVIQSRPLPDYRNTAIFTIKLLSFVIASPPLEQLRYRNNASQLTTDTPLKKLFKSPFS